jgi:hypothetical protein
LNCQAEWDGTDWPVFWPEDPELDLLHLHASLGNVMHNCLHLAIFEKVEPKVKPIK